jgi:hypothetical protein
VPTHIRSTDFAEFVWIAAELAKRLPQLSKNKLYLASIPHYLSAGAYKFRVAAPTATSKLEDADAFGFVTFYGASATDKHHHPRGRGTLVRRTTGSKRCQSGSFIAC